MEELCLIEINLSVCAFDHYYIRNKLTTEPQWKCSGKGVGCGIIVTGSVCITQGQRTAEYIVHFTVK